MTDDPSPEEIVAMNLWRELPEDVAVYVGPPKDVQRTDGGAQAS